MQFSKLFKVKEGKLDTLREWFTVLAGERKEEALATFEDEHVTREIFVHFRGNDGTDYVIAANEAEGEIERGDRTVPINAEHNQIKAECLEPISDVGAILVDLHA